MRRAKFGAAELAESMTHEMAWQGEAAFEGLKESSTRSSPTARSEESGQVMQNWAAMCARAPGLSIKELPREF